MAQLVVRDLDEDVKARLKHRAERNKRSMEDEVRQILRNAVKDQSSPASGLGSRMAARFAKVGLDRDLPELKGQSPRPPRFDK